MGRQITPRGCTVVPANKRGDNVTVRSLSWDVPFGQGTSANRPP